jgi:hypothetical protein
MDVDCNGASDRGGSIRATSTLILLSQVPSSTNVWSIRHGPGDFQAELDGLYAGLVMVGAACIAVDKKAALVEMV